MKILNNNKLVSWIIIVLIISNALSITALAIHIVNDNNDMPKHKMHRANIHRSQKHHEGRKHNWPQNSHRSHKGKPHFDGNCPLNQLEMNEKQIEKFSICREEFKISAKEIKIELKEKRHALLHELHQEEIDSLKLSQLTQDIGSLHTDLKLKIIDFYLDIKNECTPEQQEKLHLLFKDLN